MGRQCHAGDAVFRTSCSSDHCDDVRVRRSVLYDCRTEKRRKRRASDNRNSIKADDLIALKHDTSTCACCPNAPPKHIPRYQPQN